MSKAYSSKLTRAQYDFLSDLIPEPKPGCRKRKVDMWEILNAIFASFGGMSKIESVAWRFLRIWQTVYTYFRNWRKARRREYSLRQTLRKDGDMVAHP